MSRMSYFDDASVPAEPVYWVAAFGVTSSFSDGTGVPVTATYAFDEAGTNRAGQELRVLTDAEKASIRDAVAKVTANTGLTMVEGTVEEAGLTFAASSDTTETAYGRTYYAAYGSDLPVEVLAYDHPYSDPGGLARNSYIYKHELLHGVGLGHSTRAFGSGLPIVIPEGEDSGTTLFGRWSGAYFNDIQLFDLAALQYLYGPNPEVRAGDDVYVPGLGAFDPLLPNENVPLLWDGGGHDTIDLSGVTERAWVSLKHGELNRVGVDKEAGILDAGTFSINYRSAFEDLIGGTRADRLSGNQLDNTIEGGRGRDWIFGANGKDLLEGGVNIDRLRGGNGADTLVGGNGDDALKGGTGADEFRYFAFRNGGDDTIADFKNGVDMIRIEGPARFDHDDVTIEADGSDTLISFGATSIRLSGVDAGLIGAEDILIG